MNIVIAQYWTENLSYGKYTEAINKKYCEEKGYTYHVETNTDKIKTGIEDREFTWYKPKFLTEVLELYNPDYVLFLDADAVICDDTQNIEDFIDENYDAVLAKDYSEHSLMNAGVILLKNSEWSKDFLNKWWDSAEYLQGKDATRLSVDESNLEKIGYFKNALWHDQTCLSLLYENISSIQDKIKIIENRSFNHREYEKHNFIFHAFGYGHLRNRTIDMRYKEKYQPKPNFENINLIIYHIYCVNNYLEIVEEQLMRLKYSGLYDWCDKLEITCINTEGDFSGIENLIEGLDKVNLNKYLNNNYEFEGINKVWEYSQKNTGKVFYFHTKGVSNSFTDADTKKSSEWKKRGVSWWKENMEYFLIDRYKDCIEKLESYDQCGVTCNNKWWWGNFWWSNLDFIYLNSQPDHGDRWYFEAWLNHYREPSVHEFYHFDFNPYYSIIPYDISDKEKYKNSKIKLTKAYYGVLGEQQDEGRKKADRVVVDVTEEIKNNLESNQNKGFNIRVDNNIAGDPFWGIQKVLEVHFLLDNKECILVADENKNLTFFI